MTEPMTPIPQELLDEAHEIMDQFNTLMSHDCRVDIIAQALAKERKRLRTIWIERCDRASAMARDFEQLAWERGKRIAELERPAPSRQLPEDVQELIGRLKHPYSQADMEDCKKAATALEQMAQARDHWEAQYHRVVTDTDKRIDELEAEVERAKAAHEDTAARYRVRVNYSAGLEQRVRELEAERNAIREKAIEQCVKIVQHHYPHGTKDIVADIRALKPPEGK